MTITPLKPIGSKLKAYPRIQIEEWENEEFKERNSKQFLGGMIFIGAIVAIGINTVMNIGIPTVVIGAMFVIGAWISVVNMPDWMGVDDNTLDYDYFKRENDYYNYHHRNYDGTINMDGDPATSH